MADDGPPRSPTLSDPTNPYEMLEPEGAPGREEPAPPTAAPRAGDPPGFGALLRGIGRRCPRCGDRDVFAGWFTIRDRCPRCQLRLEREEGGFLGAMTVNYLVTTMAWIVMLVVWLLLDLPDVHVLALTLASVAFVGVFPLLFYRSSKTIWAAVDYLVYRSSPDYGRRDAADRAGGNGGHY